jgi:palmitoyltransferase
MKGKVFPQKNENENNTLSIIDDPNTKYAITKVNNALNNNEMIPIKNIKEIRTAEEYYSLYYPEFKLFKIYGILFCKMGNLITFNFDKNNNFTPKLSIGPHWYLTLFLNLLITFLGSILFYHVIKSLYYLFHYGFFILYFCVLFCLNRTAIIHPGNELNKNADINKYKYCQKCKIYYNPDEKVYHCSFCKVCIQRLDHHCVWIGKCVGKNNVWQFYEMVVVVAIFYIYLIICFIIFSFEKK